MTVSQQIMWTALPNGVEPRTGKLALSIFVSPRLKTDQNPSNLDLFPDFVHWANTQVSFQVKFGGIAQSLTATPTGILPDPAYWDALFSEATYVRPYKFKSLHLRKIRSFPASNVFETLKKEYLKVATTSPTELPDYDDLAGKSAFGKLALVSPRGDFKKRSALRTKLKSLLDEYQAVPPQLPTDDPAFDFFQVAEFHRNRNKTRMPLQIPTIDFHQMISMVGEYHDLLRYLGLVYDVSVDYPQGVSSPTTVQVTPVWTSLLGPNNLAAVRPKTRCVISPTVFLPAPRTSDPEIGRGYLRLTDKLPDQRNEYQVIQVDVDGAAEKVLGFANNLVRTKAKKTEDTPKKFSVPSLRSGGLSLVRVGRALSTVGLFTNAKNLNVLVGASPMTLNAEDVTARYRVDVFDVDAGKWFPLGARDETYDFTNVSGLQLLTNGEGGITLAVTQPSDGSGNDLFLQESMFRWPGWSLAAPRPGAVASPSELPSHPTNDAVTEFKLETKFVPTPGTLPVLRFGRDYRFRVRAVDLACNSIPFGDPAATNFLVQRATPPTFFGRFEPVPPPTVLMRDLRTEGESVEHVIIRSQNWDTPVAQVTMARRHLVPPKTSEMMAEQHGELDLPGGLDQSAYQMLAARSDGSFGVKDGAGNYTQPGATKDPKNYDQPYFDVDVLAFPVENGNNSGVPYLPDPIARGVTFRNLPGAELEVKQYSWNPSWPNVTPILMNVIDDGTSGPPTIQTGPPRLLTLRLPKGEERVILYSSHLTPTALEALGLWHWIEFEAGLGAAAIADLRAKALDGLHWMLSPSRKLFVRHAVRQPLETPEFDHLGHTKLLGNTFATLADIMKISRKTTSRVDVNAHWTEVTDIVGSGDNVWEPRHEVPTDAMAFQVPVAKKGPELELDVRDMRHEFHDTHYRQVTYSAVATTRDSEYFVEHTEILFNDQTPHLLNAQGVVEGSEEVRSLDGTTPYHPGDYVMEYDAGTIARTPTSTIPFGEEVDVKFLPAPITRNNTVDKVLDIKNSARPDAPKVVYAIPTFSWDRAAPGGGGYTSHRREGGIRVYLERPWWSSGDGELLGAVVWPSPPLPNLIPVTTPDRLKPFVSQWGMDPVYRAGSLVPRPRLADFTNKVATANQLTLDELPGVKVAVAGFQVGFDSDRTLWYCDIDMDPATAYMPFVRLALARYQPISVPDCHLSRVVLADFIQLTPSRFATLTSTLNNSVVHVAVSGFSYSKVADVSGPSIIKVTVQEQDPDVPGELGWFPVPDSEVTLESSAGRAGKVWSGDVTLPGARGSGPMRLLIEEFEYLRAPTSSLIGIATAPRLVYSEIIPL